MVLRGGGMPRQQLQQHWSRGGGIPHQHQRSSHAYLRPGRRDSSNRSSNRHGQSLRPELAGSTTAGATQYNYRRTHLSRQAHRCVRFTAVAVAANMGTSPNTVLHRRFEGTSSACGQYGHIWRKCALSSRGQPHLNVFTSSGECLVTDAYGADTIVIPQPQQHHQLAVDLGGENIPFQQSSDSIYYSNGASGGGGGDGDAIGTGVQQQMAVAGQQSFGTVAHGSGGEDSDNDG